MSQLSRLSATASALALIAASLAQPAAAATCTWNGGSASYGTGGAWSCGIVPTILDDVFIDGSNGVVSIVNAAGSQGALTLSISNGDQLRQASSTFTVAGPTVSNNGTITIGTNSQFRGSGATLAFSGTGTIVLDDSSSSFTRFLDTGTVATLGSGQTVRGSGDIGVNAGIIINNGLISADASGRTLTIDALGGSGGLAGAGVGVANNAAFQNSGTLQATAGGTLTIAGGRYENSGTIRALAGSRVIIGSDARIVGGTLASVGDGVIVDGAGTAYLDGVTLAAGSRYELSSALLNLGGTLVNNGTFAVGVNSQLRAETGTVTVSGTGTIVLDDSSGSFTRAFDANGAVLGPGQTVRGSGEIGVNAGVISSAGLVSADVNGRTLTIDARGGNAGLAGLGIGAGGNAAYVNAGTLQATGGGTLVIDGGRYDNNGTIQALNGSVVIIGSDARIVGGTLASSGTGVIADGAGTAYLDGVTLAAGSSYTLTSAVLNLGTSFVNNGTLALRINTQARSETPTLVISGTGTIILDDSTGSFTQFLDNATTTTLGSGQTVRGSGSIGLNTAVIINNAAVRADAAARTLTIDARGGNGGLTPGTGVGSGTAALFNTATMEAVSGGTLAFSGGRYENSAAGLLRAGAGSTLVIGSDARIVGGTLQSTGTGVIIDGGGTAYLDNVTLATGSNYALSSAALNLGTTFVNNGTLTLGTNTQVRSDTPTLVISGSGTIILDNSAGSFTQLFDNATAVTLGAGQLVRGSGSVGLNAAVVTNNGVISADIPTVTAQGITIDARGGNAGLTGTGVGTGGNAALFNTNVIEATNGSTLTIAGGRYENNAVGVMRAGVGSTLVIGSDARIVGGTLQSTGTGVIIDGGGTAYLDNVTLATGSNYNLSSTALNLGTGFVNNGTLALGINTQVRGETATLVISGTGTIALDDSIGSFTQFLDTANTTTLGAGQTVRGSGSIGLNTAVIINNGVISADVSGRALAIDVGGGNAGVAGDGVGTGNDSALLNTGTIQTSGGGIITLAGGRYENTATGTFATGTSGNFTMASDALLNNLQGGNTLSLGTYRSAGGTLALRGTGASIAVIGSTNAGTDTVVTLSGAGSAITAQAFNGATVTAIDASLARVAQSGRLEILNGRNLTIVAGDDTFTNDGIVQIGGGTLTASSTLNNNTTLASEIFGFGAISGPVFNSGTVRSAGGTLTVGVVSGSGIIQSDAGSTLAIGGFATTGTLNNNGNLALGADNVEVAIDYTNANFGSGNAFNGRANVTGSGLILADSATQTLSGAGLSGNILNVGNVRLGDTAATTLTITNNGTLTTLRGAVQTSAAPSVSIAGADFVVEAGGGSASATISFTANAAGSLAGQTIAVVNNFDNVAEATLNLQGAAFNAAVGAVTPDPVNIGNVRQNTTASGVITIANTAPVGAFSEGLRVTGTSTTGGAGVSGVTTGVIAAGGSDAATVTISTASTGAQSGTVSFSFATNGTGTSGLAEAAIAGGVVSITANVFALANPFVTSPLQFGNVQQGSVQTRTITVENRQLPGVLAAFQEGLNAGIGAIAGDVQSASGSIVNLAAGGLDTTTLTVRLNTGTAGTRSGTVEILLQSNGTGTSGLGNFDLPAQTVSVLGQVETEATVFRLAEATLAPTNVAFGSRRIGDASGTQVLTITNSAANDGFSESLDAASGATTGRATVAGGPVTLLAAGSSSTAISVGVDTSVAGANGTITINFASNGAGTSGFGITPLGSQVVTLGGAVYQAAIAGAQPAAITLAARRVGDAAASANLTVTNTAPGTGGFTEALSATATANNGFTTNGNGPVTTADLGVGGSQVIAVSRGTGTAGAFTGNVAIANTSRAATGSGLADLALAGQSVAVNANVYAAAVAVVDTATVDFGTVRQGSASPSFALGITNGASGALTDSLVTSIGATPAGVTGTAPGALAGGASGNANFSLATAAAGQVSGGTTLGFVSANPEMADLALASQSITFTGTVTEVAIAQLFKASGAGGFSGSGNAYTLNLGSYLAGSGPVGADIGVLNAIGASSFAETLGGNFVLAPGAGYSFSGASFAGLVGSSSDIANLLTFDFTGLSAGLYTTTLTFNGFSRFDGLTDLALTPIELTVTTRITTAGAVPEPAIWAQLILGFGTIGGFVRRRRAIAKETVTC